MSTEILIQSSSNLTNLTSAFVSEAHVALLSNSVIFSEEKLNSVGLSTLLTMDL